MNKDQMPINIVANHACEHLPEGWRIELFLERHAGWVELYDPQCYTHEFPSNHEHLDITVFDAVEYAIEQANAQGKNTAGRPSIADATGYSGDNA